MSDTHAIDLGSGEVQTRPQSDQEAAMVAELAASRQVLQDKAQRRAEAEQVIRELASDVVAYGLTAVLAKNVAVLLGLED